MQRSRSHAEHRLHAALQKGRKVVPCPACGHVQQHMVPLAQWQRHRWLNKVSMAAWLLAFFLLAPALMCQLVVPSPNASNPTLQRVGWWCAFGIAAGAGLGLPVLRSVLAARYDPNRAPVEVRKHTGQRLAVSKEQYLRTVPAQ